MSNILGYLSIKNDLLGRNLIITYNLSSPFYSCYLCSQYAEYCANASVPVEYIYLTTNILYNLQILTLDNNDEPLKVYTFNVESELGYKQFQSNITIPIDMLFQGNTTTTTKKSHCHNTYSFLMIGLITIDAFATKEIVTLTHPPIIPGNNRTILCRPGPQYTQLGIDCNKVPIIYPITYTVDECLLLSEPNQTIVTQPINYYPPLYWYSEMVFDNTTPSGAFTICGERYDTLLFKSGLYQAVCYRSPSHGAKIQKSWWITLFLQVMSLESNVGDQQQQQRSHLTTMVIQEARDLLERHCGEFNVASRRLLAINMKIANLYSGGLTPYINQTELCLGLYEYFETHYNHTKNDNFFHLFNLWYIEMFKFIIYPDKTTETKIYLAIGLTTFIILFMICAIGILQFTLKVKVKKTNQNVSIDDPLDKKND